jgi:hypothetical protein
MSRTGGRILHLEDTMTERQTSQFRHLAEKLHQAIRTYWQQRSSGAYAVVLERGRELGDYAKSVGMSEPLRDSPAKRWISG